MKPWMIWTLMLLAAQPVAQAAEESTLYHTLVRIQYNARVQIAYFASDTGSWDAPSCPGAVYVSVPASETPGIDSLLALAMQAKTAGTPVSFMGECAGNYFKAYYIRAK